MRMGLTCFVFSIICRPYAVTLEEMGRQGSLPIVAPVKPYTEFALIYTPNPLSGGACPQGLIGRTFKASCRPSSTARLNGSVSFFRSALARFRAEMRSSSTVGKRPLRFAAVAKKSTCVSALYPMYPQMSSPLLGVWM